MMQTERRLDGLLVKPKGGKISELPGAEGALRKLHVRVEAVLQDMRADDISQADRVRLDAITEASMQLAALCGMKARSSAAFTST